MDPATEQLAQETTRVTSTSRRRLLGAATSSFALAASGLFLPQWLDNAEARDDNKGDRRGKDNKRRNKQRHRGDKQDDIEENESTPPQGHGPFRAAALTVVQSPFRSLQYSYTFYYRVKTGLDEYGPWIESSTVTPDRTDSFRYAPDRYRIGVLLRGHVEDGDLPQQAFIDIRNLSFGYPQGSASAGAGLNPTQNTLGSQVIGERGFAQPSDWFGDNSPAVGRWHWAVNREITLVLKRLHDSDNFIEFQLFS